MSYHPPRPARRLLLTPEDKEAPARIERQRRLGLGQRPEPALDVFADRLAEHTATPYAMVNLPDDRGQFHAGLHLPPAGPPARAARPGRRRAARGGPTAAQRPRVLPARAGAAQGAGAGGRAGLPPVRRQCDRRRVRHPLLSRRPAHRLHGHGAGHGQRRGRHAPAEGPLRPGDHQAGGRRTRRSAGAGHRGRAVWDPRPPAPAGGPRPA
jgi:hypothetical protein